MFDIPSISGIVAAVGVMVGVVFTVLQLRDIAKTRRTKLALELHSTWTREEMVEPFLKVMNLQFEDYTDFKKRYGSYLSESPEQKALVAVINHFEAMGYLLQNKMVDFRLVELLPVSMTWKKIKPVVNGIREQFDDPRFYYCFEYLYNEMQKREQRLQIKQ